MKNSIIIYVVFLYLFVFFGFQPLSILVKSPILVLLFFVIYNSGDQRTINSNFAKILIIQIVFIIANLLSCYYYRGQGIVQSLTGPYLSTITILFYFCLGKHNLNIKQLESVLTALTLTGCTCYIIQTLNPTTPLFVTENVTEDVELGTLSRFRISGQCIISFGYFLAFNKYLVQKKIKHIITASICLLCILLMGFRIISAALLLGSFILLAKYYRFSIKIFIPVVTIFFLLLIFMQTSWGGLVFSSLFERGDQSFVNNDYIRVVSWNYHMKEFFVSPLERFLGAGIPYYSETGGSVYGREIARLQNMGYIYQDWGIIGYSWMRGVVPIACIIWFSLKGFFIKVEKQFYYLGTWLVFMVLASLLSAEMFRTGALVLQLTVLVMLDQLKVDRNECVFINA